MVERKPGDPRELQHIWMRWEEGETTPGKVLSELKTAGMRELLDELADQLGEQPGADDDAGEPEAS